MALSKIGLKMFKLFENFLKVLQYGGFKYIKYGGIVGKVYLEML
jgi:hypothetical protein